MNMLGSRDILQLFALIDSEVSDMPIKLNVKLRPSDGKPLSDPTCIMIG